MRNKRQDTINTIKVLEIPKTKLARRTDLQASRISEYIQGKSLPTATTEKIESAVENIAKVWINLGIKTDLSDIEGFNRLLAHVNRALETERLDEIAAETQVLVANCKLFS